ncbi:DNA-binding protein, partial [Salmonella sp. s54836]|uniref:DNA-binding protein n=1 Tax=Salmonella sp. s54836 TaxID=3159673 RepID=UPI00397EFD75
DQNARARLNSIAIVKPEKAQIFELQLLQMAKCGQFSGRINESEFVQLLESFNKQNTASTTVKIQRKSRSLLDDD